MSKINEKLIAHYEFNNPDNLGYDSSKNQANIVPMGTNPPELREIAGRKAVYLTAGPSDTSYFELPDSILTQISDDDGFTLSAWVFYNNMGSPWQRLLDMGSSAGKPNFFITRNLRTVCFENEDLAADPGKPLPLGEWVFVTVTITGTNGTYNITIDDNTSFTLDLIEGTNMTNITNLAGGVHKAFVNYTGSENYTDAGMTLTFTK